MLPWCKVPKHPFGKPLEQRVRETGTVLPNFPSDGRPPRRSNLFPSPFPFPLVSCDPLPQNFDDQNTRNISLNIVIYDQTPFPPSLPLLEEEGEALFSGFLSDGIPPLSDAEPTEDESDAAKPLVDDSATETPNEEVQNPSSTQSASRSIPSTTNSPQLHSHSKIVEEGEDSSAPLSSQKKLNEVTIAAPLKGKTCVIIATQGSYQPIYHEFENSKDIPKIHQFYFEGYVQSPFDTPPVNVEKYLSEKKQLQERKRIKGTGGRREIIESMAYCEICRAKIKTPLNEHQKSERHQSRVLRLDWTALSDFAFTFIQQYGEL
jgi:hypothetical protein